MKIALFTETYLPTINGVVTHVKMLKEGLTAMGHQVLIVTAVPGKKSPPDTPDVMYCSAARLNSIYNYNVASPWSYTRLKRLREFNPDIIHMHNEFGIGISGLFIAQVLNVPTVYTLHTIYEDYIYYLSDNKYMQKFLAQVISTYAKALETSVDAIIGPSRKVEHYLRGMGVTKAVHAIPNAVETELFDRKTIPCGQAHAIRQKYGIAEDECLFCFCGRLGHEKNVAWLLDAYAAHIRPEDKIKLMIIGGGPLEQELREQARALRIDVAFTGAVEHEQLPPYYAAANAYITPSVTDTCSISMLEGMAMGLPVLHIRDDLNQGQVLEGQTGWHYNNAGDMAQLMCSLRDMPAEKLAEYGQNARNFVLNMDATHLASNVMDVYIEVLKNTRNRKRKRIRFKPMPLHRLKKQTEAQESHDDEAERE
jgi:1,2-diacylglycerol 3-alpha-glucosyltransferase